MTESTAGLNLLISDKPDVERDALASAFEQGGGAVHRLGRFWDPPAFDPATVRVYGADTFCLVLQQKLGFELCSPDDELMLRVPPPFLRRQLTKRTLADLPSLQFPTFIKPVVPKQFRGAVYSAPESLSEEIRGLPPETAIFVSESVKFVNEVRSFVLHGRVLDAAAYEGEGNAFEAAAFVAHLAESMSLPTAVVVDVGPARDRRFGGHRIQWGMGRWLEWM